MSQSLRGTAVLSVDRPTVVSPHTMGAAETVRGWIVSPLFDLLFFANIYWVLAFLPIYASADGTPYIQFWMAYFLATPHRWLTLVVAVTDHDRRYGQTWLFVTLAVACALLIGIALWATGDFRALFLFYTLLLGWHFAGQHAVILKIYTRAPDVGLRRIEGWLTMAFVVYANVRLVPVFEHWLRFPSISVLPLFDYIAISVPIVLIGAELSRCSRASIPKLLYMSSFLSMWTAVLWSAHMQRNVLCSILLAAVTVYHSVEYLAMVSYYARQRQSQGTNDLFRKMAKNWTIVFIWYVIGCGLLYSIGNAFFVVVCYAVNTWASLVHCAYDGLMWRVRDPATAKALGMDPQEE